MDTLAVSYLAAASAALYLAGVESKKDFRHYFSMLAWNSPA
jgi:hypothetical protein